VVYGIGTLLSNALNRFLESEYELNIWYQEAYGEVRVVAYQNKCEEHYERGCMYVTNYDVEEQIAVFQVGEPKDLEVIQFFQDTYDIGEWYDGCLDTWEGMSDFLGYTMPPQLRKWVESLPTYEVEH
jgi:hypothetical protein